MIEAVNRTLCRYRCGTEVRDGVHDDWRCQRRAPIRDPEIPHPQPSTGAVTKAAAREPMHARGDGEHRIVLEADFPRIRRRKATGSAGQFATREESARA